MTSQYMLNTVTWYFASLMLRHNTKYKIRAARQIQDQSWFSLTAEMEATSASAYRCVMSAVKNQSRLNAAEPTGLRQELYEDTF